ncbi:MAG TPA: hypothetical protein DEP28_10150 [Bacteroidetes bacterium]|nr:hypothetical protein [Bacteroidota bacterium]HCN37067.1 hypothetical protein [Bacteroidota bacterium]HRE42215.1 helix-turn-helix transcriptional regulator [Ignavibacteria bacterium]
MATIGSRIKLLIGDDSFENFGLKVNMSKQTISKYVNNKRKPDADALTKFIRGGYSANWILTGIGNPYINTQNTIFKTKDLSEYDLVAESIKDILK